MFVLEKVHVCIRKCVCDNFVCHHIDVQFVYHSTSTRVSADIAGSYLLRTWHELTTTIWSAPFTAATADTHSSSAPCGSNTTLNSPNRLTHETNTATYYYLLYSWTIRHTCRPHSSLHLTTLSTDSYTTRQLHTAGAGE